MRLKRNPKRRSRTLRSCALALACLALLGCRAFIPAEVCKQAEVESAVHAGHLADVALVGSDCETCATWRLIYTDSYDAWAVQDEACSGTALPPEVAERIAARSGGQ